MERFRDNSQMKLSSLLTGTSSDPSFGHPAQIFPRKVKIARPVRETEPETKTLVSARARGTLSRVDEDLQRIEVASAGAPEATSQKRFEKCEGKRYNGTYLSLVAGRKSAELRNRALRPPHLGLIGNM